MPEENYETTQTDRARKADDAREHKASAAASKRAADAAAKDKFQGFTAGGPVKTDAEPRRKDFPPGSFGDSPYEAARARWNKTRKQADSLGKALDE